MARMAAVAGARAAARAKVGVEARAPAPAPASARAKLGPSMLEQWYGMVHKPTRSNTAGFGSLTISCRCSWWASPYCTAACYRDPTERESGTSERSVGDQLYLPPGLDWVVGTLGQYSRDLSLLYYSTTTSHSSPNKVPPQLPQPVTDKDHSLNNNHPPTTPTTTTPDHPRPPPTTPGQDPASQRKRVRHPGHPLDPRPVRSLRGLIKARARAGGARGGGGDLPPQAATAEADLRLREQGRGARGRARRRRREHQLGGGQRIWRRRKQCEHQREHQRKYKYK